MILLTVAVLAFIPGGAHGRVTEQNDPQLQAAQKVDCDLDGRWYHSYGKAQVS